MEKVSEGIKYLEKCLSLKPPKDIKNMAKRMIESKDEFNEYNKNEISMEEEFICEDRFLNAQECLYSGRLDDAISLYGEILNNKPEHASSIMNIGLCMLKKGKIRKSIPYFEKASRLDTSCTLSLANLMHAYHRLGDNEKSRFYADQVMKKIKNLALREIIRLVGLFIEVGDFTNARKIINKYPDYDCSTQLIFLSGILYAKRKKYESALEEFLSIKNESKIANEYFKKTKEIIDGKIKDFNFKPKIIEWGIDII